MVLTKESLSEFIQAEFKLRPEEVEPHTQLFSTGLLDSFSLLELVKFVEQQAAVRTRPIELTLENFDTVERILRFVETKGSR